MEYLGKGIYTVSTAAKMLKIRPRKLRRWIQGYTYAADDATHAIQPLFKSDFSYNSDDVIISFLDLAEFLFINAFVGKGISLQKIRQAAQFSAKYLDIEHPFAVRKIYTHGKSIFAKMGQEGYGASLIDVIKAQFQFGEVVEPFLFECIDFNQYDQAEKWWPRGKKEGIVLDPSRNFGQPIIDAYNIRTDVIYDLYKTNHSIAEIKEWYSIDAGGITAAIRFEEGFVA